MVNILKYSLENSVMKKFTIENAKSEAEQRGGKCLSKQFVSARTKLLWECSEGHQWETTLSHVRNNNNWCPVCGRKCIH